MLRQYLAVKAEHPGAIVLFRMGDFFEAFFEDAEACAERLGITLTARSKERDVPMAGVPHHAIEGYLARLMAQGQRVVLVDQVEDPKQAKGLVRREVTRVLTPGTFVDPQAPARTSRFLAAVVEGRSGFGLSLLELSTGVFRATEVPTEERLADELDRSDPSEVLVVDDGGWNGARRTTTPRPAPVDVDGILAAQFSEDEVEGLRAQLPDPALLAAAMTLDYVRATQLIPSAQDLTGTATLDHVTDLTPFEAGAGLILDAQAREHLELFEARGRGGRSFLACIDETRSGPGARLLARWLAEPLRDREAIGHRAQAVEVLTEHPSELDQLRDGLARLGDCERLVGRLAMGRATPRDLRALADTLGQAPSLLDGVGRCAERALGGSGRLEALAGVDRCVDVAEHLLALLAPEPPTDPAAPGVFAEGADDELDRLHRLSFDSQQLIAELEAEERTRSGISSLKVRYNKVFGYYIEVTKANLQLVPDRYVRKQTTVNAERYFTEELKDLETRVATAEDERRRRSSELFADLVQRTAGHVARLQALAAALAELDVLACFAHLAERRGWVRPELLEEPGIDIEAGRHPVLESMSEALGERFVPNDLRLSAEERLLVITGPNMAGKSTVMRQTALIVILAHLGAFVPADAARIGWVDRVYTRVGAGDELSQGRSTFMVEMSETAKILRSVTPRSLVLLDEIGRGTSTFDGLAIAWAVAEHLHDEAQPLTLFATHYHELTELGRTRPHAGNRHIVVREVRDRIVFLRKLAEGGANRSYGVQVARLAGLPGGVVSRARELLAVLERGERLALQGPQLDFFQVKPEEADPADEPAILERLRDVDPDDLSPREAHRLLCELRERLSAGPA
jgi:DNA mismatch repair protein MutS